MEPFHLFRYLDEQAFRYNNRHFTDADRLDIAVRGIVGKRLTYDQLTGKKMELPPSLNKEGSGATEAREAKIDLNRRWRACPWVSLSGSAQHALAGG